MTTQALTDTLEAARQAKELAETTLAAERANAELALLKGVRLAESYAWGDPVPLSEYPYQEPFRGGSGYRSSPLLTYTSVDDRLNGDCRPIYQCESDLKRIRAEGRNLNAVATTAFGVMESLINYTIGPGVTWDVEDSQGETRLVEAFKRLLDEFSLSNKLIGQLDAEIHNRCREDGEAFLALYPGRETAVPRLKLIEPDQVTQPANTRALEDWLGTEMEVNHWKYGVHTLRDPVMCCEDVEHPLGYHVVFDNAGRDWDYLPAARVVHLKRNVYGSSKRGVSDYFPVGQDIWKEAKLRENTVSGATILAAIALMRQFPAGTSLSTARAATDSHAINELSRPKMQGGNYTIKQEDFPPGTVLNTKEGVQYALGPMGTLPQPVYVEISQMAKRSIGVRWTMPEYMISSDASNGNYSSTLIAESPFVKARQRDQGFFARGFEELAWKVATLAAEGGWFNDLGIGSVAELRRRCRVMARFSDVATRDPLAQAQTLDIEKRNGVITAEEWRTETNREPADMDQIARINAQQTAGGVQGPNEVPAPAPVPATQPAPVPTGDAGVDVPSEARLNGAQITAAIEVLAGVVRGSTTPLVAVELLTAVGIERDQAEQMVKSTQKDAKPPTTAIPESWNFFKGYP